MCLLKANFRRWLGNLWNKLTALHHAAAFDGLVEVGEMEFDELNLREAVDLTRVGRPLSEARCLPTPTVDLTRMGRPHAVKTQASI